MVLFVEDELAPSTVGQFVAKAEDVRTKAGSTVSLSQELGNLSVRGFVWNRANTLGGIPGTGNVSFNNADPGAATQLNIAQTSVGGRVDELLTQLRANDFVFMQDPSNPTNGYLYQLTGTATLVPGSQPYYTFAVVVRQSNGTLSLAAGEPFSFNFIPSSSTPTGSVAGAFEFRSTVVDATSPTTFATSLSGLTPARGYAYALSTGGEPFAGETIEAEVGDVLIAIGNPPSLTTVGDWVLLRRTTALAISLIEAHFLEQASESDTVVNAADASAEDESSFVRFWLRDDPVTQAGINGAGTGLREDEAQNDVFTQDTTDIDAILYVALESSYVNETTAGMLVADVLNADGTLAQRLPFNTAFAAATELSISFTSIFRTQNAARGALLGYLANQTIRVYRTRVDRHFLLSAWPVVNATQNIMGLGISQLSEEVQAYLRTQHLPDNGADLIAQFARDTATSDPGTLPSGTELLYTFGRPSSNVEDYTVTDVDTGIFGAFSGPSTVYVAIGSDQEDIQITSFTGTEGGTGTVAEVTPSPLPGKRTYRVILPVETSATNFFVPTGTVTNTLSYRASSEIKIGTDNFDDALEADYQRLHGGQLTEALEDFQHELTVTHQSGTDWRAPANPTPVRATITRKWAAFTDENRTGASPFLGNRFDDLDNPTFSATPVWSIDGSDERFPGKTSFSLGRVDAAGASVFGSRYQKLIAFSFFITDPDFDADLPLLKLGTRRLLMVRRSGIYVTQGRLDGTIAESTFQERLQKPGAGNTIQYLEGVGASSMEWDVTDGLTFPLTVTLRIKAVDNGVTGAVKTLEYAIADRDVSQAQASEVVAVNVPGGGTRDETLLLSYDGATHLFTVATAGLALNGTSDVSRLGIEATHDDTQDLVNSSTTRDEPLNTQVTVVRNEVKVLLLIEKTNPLESSADPFLSLKMIVNGAQENNIATNFRSSDYAVSDLQFGPNSGDDVALSELQVYDWDDLGDPGRVPTHSELYAMWQRFVYLGLFIPPEEDYRNFTLNGGLVLTNSAGATRDLIALIDTIPSARLWRDSGTFIAAASVTANLPSGTQLSDFVLITIEWNTGQTDGSASDNAHRRFSSMVSAVEVYEASGPNVIPGTSGRGAENFGVQITAGTEESTSVSAALININDAGSAVLPAGSQITKVRFY